VDQKEYKHFIVGDALAYTIESLTGDTSGKYNRRDFVAPLIDYCVDGCYNGKIGIVYGLRSTGKTVGMLQAAEALIECGHKVAYVRFNYEEAAMGDVNIEIKDLAKQGYTHFFIDEATYLEGFLNGAAEWPDMYVPANRIKITISGTDSFLINIARGTSLFHRCVQFSTNWNPYDEYRNIQGKSYEDYKAVGGIFTPEPMPEFIQAAVVKNLLHTLEHCVDDAGRTNEYTTRLGGIDDATMYKAIISILRCSVEADIKRHFVKYANEKNIMELGPAIQNWTKQSKQDVKKQVAEALSVYSDFKNVKNPEWAIEALISYLVKVGCLGESFVATSDIGSIRENIYYFTHNALMYYAVQETINGAIEIGETNSRVFQDGIKDAAEGYLNESIVFAHVLISALDRIDTKALFKETVFKYRDFDREIDVVDVDHTKKLLYLIEVKSKSKIDVNRVFKNEAKHLYDDEVLKNIGADDEYTISRIIVYHGESKAIPHAKGDLVLSNIEEFLCNTKDLQTYLNNNAVQR
jgi:predicted AAA+ superfamily ATPase